MVHVPNVITHSTMTQFVPKSVFLLILSAEHGTVKVTVSHATKDTSYHPTPVSYSHHINQIPQLEPICLL